MRPTNGNVLVKLDEEVSVSKGGIVLPDSSKEKASRGEVVAVPVGGSYHENGRTFPIEVKVGDRVLFPPYAAKHEVKMDGENLIVIKASDILLIL